MIRTIHPAPRLPAFVLLLGLLAGLPVVPAHAATADLDTEVLAIQTEWARLNYGVTDRATRVAGFEQLATRAATLATRYPQRAEPLIWEGIVLSTAAGAKGGLDGLSLAKQARERLERSLVLDPEALAGSAHTSLGTLYHKVPGFPLGFGSDRKAAEHLREALRLNPDGIDPNYFYAELLYDDDDYSGALEHLRKALGAPPRPGRESADLGRRREIEDLMAEVQDELR